VQTKRGTEQYERQLRQEYANDHASGRDPFAGPPPTFAEFAPEWFERYVLVQNRICAQSEKRRVLAGHLVPEFGHLRPSWSAQ
jgi:hypothetical protein